jgi:3-hydroxy-3-methylglutaryl CoA synthase
MLCFHGPNLKQYQPALKSLIKKEMLIEEKFKGGYSLTKVGYETMREHTVPV